MDLRKTGIPEEGATAIGSPDGSRVRSLRVGREIENIGIPSRCEHNHVGSVAADLTRQEVSRHDSPRSAVHNHDIEQLAPDMHCYSSGCDLLLEGLISTQQELLSSLASRVECPFDLHAAEGPIVQKPAVFSCTRHALSDALIDDVDTDFRQTVNVGFTGAEIAAFDGVLEKAENAVPVISIVLRSVHPSLGGDRVCPSRGVVIGKAVDVVALLAESRGPRRSCQTGGGNDDRMFPAVGGGYPVPLLSGAIPTR